MLAAVTSYPEFFGGAATVAGALTGLLFVALSVAPERLRRTAASAEHQSIAATAFTALVDALFVSLVGIEPGGNLRVTSLVLGLIGLTSSAGLAARLWRARIRVTLSRRWPYLLAAIIAIYAAQVVTALVAGSREDIAARNATFVLVLFAAGIARSWELLGLRGGGPLDLLAQYLGEPDADPAAGPPTRNRQEPDTPS